MRYRGWAVAAFAAVLPGPAVASVEAAPAVQVRVASINMWGIPHVSTHIDARFAALAERLNGSDLDLVGLQEVWADDARLALREALRTRFPYQADFQTDTGGSGLLILSRWPIGERHFRAFPVNGKPWKLWHGDWWGKKGVGVVRVDAPGGGLWFATTHLHARYRPRPPGGDEMDDEYAVDRWHQAHVVRATVAEYAGDQPAIVTGDFNFTRLAASYRMLTRAQPSAPPAASDPAWRDVWETSPLRRIDYVWTRPGAHAAWATVEPTHDTFEAPVPVAGDATQRLSDHRAVRATLAWRRAPVAGGPSAAGSVPPSVPLVRPRGRALWRLLRSAGYLGECAVVLAVVGVLLALSGLVLPWRLREQRSAVAVARGIVGAGLLLLALGLLRVTLETAGVRAAAYAFWRETVPRTAVAPGLPRGEGAKVVIE